MHGPLDQRVRWVHVSEVGDLSNLLEGGELVLTTGLALLDEQHRDDYLPGLAAAGAAGVIIELGLHIDEVPESVLASGVSLGLPVIVLHRRVRFVDVTEEVHRRIVAEQYAEVDYARRVHETFTGIEHAPGVAERDRRSGRRNARVRTRARGPQPAGAGVSRGTARRPRNCSPTGTAGPGSRRPTGPAAG